ncbi:unnamed protein product [Rhizophagus irregularis]|nr:unnamed protein product [Rhizophagus irregularis]
MIGLLFFTKATGKILCAFTHNGFNGKISNVRYFNWRLSAEEVKEDFFNEYQTKPIVYGSRIALVHVSTRKYLSTKRIKYDLGPNNQVICNRQEIDLENDVWIVIGASGTRTIASDHNGDIISLFHIRTNRPALCSHTTLLGDESQEVFCHHGYESERNNKWRIELID